MSIFSDISVMPEMLSNEYLKAIENELKLIDFFLGNLDFKLKLKEEGKPLTPWATSLVDKAIVKAVEKLSGYIERLQSSFIEDFLQDLNNEISQVDEKLSAIQRRIQSSNEAKWTMLCREPVKFSTSNYLVKQMFSLQCYKNLKASLIAQKDNLLPQSIIKVTEIENFLARIKAIPGIWEQVEVEHGEQNNAATGSSSMHGLGSAAS